MVIKPVHLTTLTFLLLLLTTVISCKKLKDNELDTLESKFHGKYMIVSATADKEVDINLDGKADKNVLNEIPELRMSYLELIVRGNVKKGVFSQFWQNQYFQGIEGKPVSYNPSILVNFQNQATVASFTADPKAKVLLLSRASDQPDFPLPISVEVLEDQRIRIIHSKEIFTTTGWRTIVFEVVYKRFSPSV